MMITISKENYLKAIAEAEAEGKTVIPALLAHWLSVTPPAVTAALKRLRRDGLVTLERGSIQLTSEGRKVAERTILRHHLIERMLFEIFGMGWVDVHEEAERLEHAVSPAFEKKLVKMLGHKETCPHGNGLAVMSPEQRRKKGQRLLSEADAGSTYRVFSVYERDRKLLEFLRRKRNPPGHAFESGIPELRRDRHAKGCRQAYRAGFSGGREDLGRAGTLTELLLIPVNKI